MSGRSMLSSLALSGVLIATMVPVATARQRPATVGVPIPQQAYLKASNAGAGDGFGNTLAISGDTIVIGAPYEKSNGTGAGDDSAANAGAVYVFARTGSGWVQEAYLKASNAAANDYFGADVAIDGDTIVVGAWGEDSNGTSEGDNSVSGSGAAYVFTRSGTTWTQQAYLKAANPDLLDSFGLAVAIDGDTVVVGAPSEDGNGSSPADNSVSGSGAAYVFTRSGTTWTQQAYLKAAIADLNDGFGGDVAIDPDAIVVGASLEDGSAAGGPSDNSASNAGAAYVFSGSGAAWTQTGYLKAANAEAGDRFGYRVGLFGDRAVVSAAAEGSNGSGPADNTAPWSGAAYVFIDGDSGWVQEDYLKASNAEADDGFGESVAIAAELIVVGANCESSNGSGGMANNDAACAGAAYVYRLGDDGWDEVGYLKASQPNASDLFGTSVGVDAGTIVVGGQNEDSAATTVNGDQADNSASNSGAAWVYGIDVTGPVIGRIRTKPDDPASGSRVTVTAVARDPSGVAGARIRVGRRWGNIAEMKGVGGFGQTTQSLTATVDLPRARRVRICIRAKDGLDNRSPWECDKIDLAALVSVPLPTPGAAASPIASPDPGVSPAPLPTPIVDPGVSPDPSPAG